METLNIVEVQWPVSGDRIPADHNYRLYSALVERQPALKETDWQLKTINGIPDKNGWIKLASQSRLAIRCEIANIPLFLLDSQTLRIGSCYVQLGQAQFQSLLPYPLLQSRLITIKVVGQTEISEFEFGVCLAKQLLAAGISENPILGKRKTLKIKEKIIIGYAVRFENLTPQTSLILQQQGIGGRRKMGCGVFTK